MENQRLLLYITLFFIIYLLWAEWQMDYGPKPEVPPVTETTSAVKPGATEVPEAATAPDEASIIESRQAEQTGSQRIRVITDVFDIEVLRLAAGRPNNTDRIFVLVEDRQVSQRRKAGLLQVGYFRIVQGEQFFKYQGLRLRSYARHHAVFFGNAVLIAQVFGKTMVIF